MNFIGNAICDIWRWIYWNQKLKKKILDPSDFSIYVRLRVIVRWGNRQKLKIDETKWMHQSMKTSMKVFLLLFFSIIVIVIGVWCVCDIIRFVFRWDTFLIRHCDPLSVSFLLVMSGGGGRGVCLVLTSIIAYRDSACDNVSSLVLIIYSSKTRYMQSPISRSRCNPCLRSRFVDAKKRQVLFTQSKN